LRHLRTRQIGHDYILLDESSRLRSAGNWQNRNPIGGGGGREFGPLKSSVFTALVYAN
jgi:hypothetical protein